MPSWMRWGIWFSLWLVVLAATVWFLGQIRATITVFGLAWLLAYLLNPTVTAIEGNRLGPIKKVGRGQAVMLVYALLLGVLLAAGSILTPLVTDQVSSLAQTLDDPRLETRLTQAAEDLQASYLETVPEQLRGPLEESIGGSAARLAELLSKGFQKLTSFVLGFFNGIFLFITALIVAIYMLLGWNDLMARTLEVVPEKYRDEVVGLSQQMNQIFGGYLKATILTSAACGVFTFLSLTLLSLVTGKPYPYTVVVSLVAGITYAVPVLGIVASSLLAGILAYLPQSDLGFAVVVLVVVNVVNLAIDRTLSPKLMSEAIGVSPLFVMFGAFAGAEVLGGVWGMILGIPVAAMAKALLSWFHARFLLPPGTPVAEAELPPKARRAPESMAEAPQHRPPGGDSASA